MTDLNKERQYIKNHYNIDDEIHLRAPSGRRWCQCIHCGVLMPTDDMPIYGGPGREMNRGECRQCLNYLGYIDIPQQ